MEQFEAPHGLIVDKGIWPGGLGPHEFGTTGREALGALTLVRLDTQESLDLFDHLADPRVDALKSEGFLGLVQWGLNLSSADGVPRIEGEIRGWPWLHYHAFLSGIEKFGDVLRGTFPTLPSKFVVVAPVTIPPWPAATSGGCRKIQVKGLTPIRQGKCFWHDVRIDQEKQEIHTAGLDGMVAIVRGEGGGPRTTAWS